MPTTPSSPRTPSSPTSPYGHSSPPASPPTQTFHASLVPTAIPTPALLGSAAGGAHYSGARVGHRHSDVARASFGNAGIHAELDESRKKLMDDLKELYECRPTLELFERIWDRNAKFEDPLALCKGFDEVAPQWFAMPKIFSSSSTVATRVLSSTYHPNRLVYAQTQDYKFRLFGVKKTIKSMVIVDLNDDGKITSLVDQWNGQDPPTWWGATSLRRLNAKTTSWLVRVPTADRKSD